MRVAIQLLLVMLLAGSVCAQDAAPPRDWHLPDGRSITGRFVSLVDDEVTIQPVEGEAVTLAFERLGHFDKQYVAQRQEEHPPAPPAWVEGYRVRYRLRLIDDPLKSERKTVIARIPTGGWLKDDATDLVLRSASGRALPVVVLSHDARGETLIQFERTSIDRWYWLYASNPDAPGKDAALEQRIAATKTAAEEAGFAKIRLQKEAADKAVILRDITNAVNEQRSTAGRAQEELDEWAVLLPQRVAASEAAAAKVPPAEVQATQAADALAPLQADADAKTETARALQREANTARAAANQAKAAHEAAVKAAADAKQAADQAHAAYEAARSESLAAADAARRAPEEEREAAQAAATAKAEAAEQTKQQRDAARQAAAQAAATVAPAERAMQQADRDAIPKEQKAAEANELAKEARLVAAPFATAKREADQTLAQLRQAATAAANAVNEARQRIAAATKIKQDAEAELAKLEPRLKPAQDASAKADADAQHAISESQRLDNAYFDLAASTDPRLHREGLSVEFREWAGDDLTGWKAVVEGLAQSDNVIGSTVVGEVMQNVNPFRRSDPRHFAASYRGYLNVQTPGVYSFFVNGDDAAFLFIKGYKVYSRTGSNAPLRGRVPLYSIGADIQLEAGVHPFELHHVVGNTPGATGLCVMMWLPPGATQWQFVPREAFVRADTATPVAIEARDGRPVAAFSFGMDDTLSADGLTLYMSRFNAFGAFDERANLTWNFGDGVTGSGAEASHIYFQPGDYEVTLKSHPDVPAFRRRCHVWTPPLATSPLALQRAVAILSKTDVSQLDVARLNDVYHFLRICEQDERWPVLQRVCEALLEHDELDIKYRALLHATLMEAVGRQGQAAAALKVRERALEEVGDLRTLRALVLLKAGDVQRDHIRDYKAADELYAQVIEENRRLRHPLVRRAAIHWGDMFMAAGDLARAGEAYRLAQTLGSVGPITEGQGDPVKRGALLRVAEQQLRSGDIHQTRRLLTRIESEFPEQKLEGLYRYLRGEAERNGGRYEQAIANFEVLLQLRQWAGYRAHAMYGIADSYYRMGRYDDALAWLADLKDAFPDFYQQRQLAGYEQTVAARRERAPAGTGGGARLAVEPDEFDATSLGGVMRLVSDGAIEGAHALLVDNPGGQLVNLPPMMLSDLPSQGSLWVELWYRDEFGVPGQRERFLYVDIRDENGQRIKDEAIYTPRTYGQWQKAAISLPAPATVDGTAVVGVKAIGGLVQIDSIRIEPVSDRQSEALRAFVEGADPQ